MVHSFYSQFFSGNRNEKISIEWFTFPKEISFNFLTFNSFANFCCGALIVSREVRTTSKTRKRKKGKRGENEGKEGDTVTISQLMPSAYLIIEQ